MPCPSVQIKFTQSEYITGDQISGELFLRIPENVESGGIELVVWCLEENDWTEAFETLTPTQVSANKLLREASKGARYSGARLAYHASCVAHVPESKTLTAGNYLIPFTYILPFKAPATLHLKTAQVTASIRHYVMGRVYDRQGCAPAQNVEEETLLRFLHRPDMSPRQPHVIAFGFGELTVVERASHQASLRPYAHQCTLSIPHLLLGTGDLKLSAKKLTEPAIAGEAFPLAMDVVNGSMTHLLGLVVALRHNVSLQSYSGICKHVSYTHTKWIRRLNLTGHTRKPCSAHITLPLTVPLPTPSTSHGSLVSSEFEVIVSCRYSGKYTMRKHATCDDIVVPLVVWPSTVHPRRRQNLASWSLLLLDPLLFARFHPRAAIEGEEEEADGSAQKRTDTPKTMIQTEHRVSLASDAAASPNGQDRESNQPVVELPTVSVEIESAGKAATSTVDRLASTLPTVTWREQTEQFVYRASGAKARLDMGLWMAPGLAKAIMIEGQPKKRAHKKAAVTRVRRTVAPLKK